MNQAEIGFSALQRAENSSIRVFDIRRRRRARFSALQRAENSSMMTEIVMNQAEIGFSALQRAENSSISHLHPPEAR